MGCQIPILCFNNLTRKQINKELRHYTNNLPASQCSSISFCPNFVLPSQEFDRARAFNFLTDIKRKFIETYGLQAATAIAYAMNIEFSQVLAVQQRHYSESKDRITQVAGQVDEMREIMIKNIGEFGVNAVSSCLLFTLSWLYLSQNQ